MRLPTPSGNGVDLAPGSSGAVRSTALDALQSSEAILKVAGQSFFELISETCEGIIMVDKSGHVVWINDRYERYLPTLGYKRPEDVIGKDVEDVVPNSLMRRVVETGKPILLDIIENRELRFVVMRIPLRDEHNEVIGAVGLILYDHLEALKPLVSRIGKLQQDLQEAHKQLAAQRRVKYNFSSFVGTSAAALEVKRQARRAAQLNTTVLLLGETGTGKELLAQAIHAASKRATRPFIAVNVAAIPENLLEAEFFGVAPGAYTGADKRGRDGKFKLADGGTLLLDEIGDMPLALQAKLLRVLQEQEFEPLGSNKVIKADVRVIAATSRNLEQLVEENRFRADLYYRLNVLPIRVPPLRERGDDLGPLCESLLEHIVAQNGLPPREVAPEALALLAAQPWRGNVRELGNVLEQVCLLSDRTRLTHADFARVLPAPAPTLTGPAPKAGAIVPLPERIAALEREAIREALAVCDGNKLRAARLLGISRASLYQKLS